MAAAARLEFIFCFPVLLFSESVKENKIIGTGINEHSSSTHFLLVLECAIIRKM